MKLLLALVGVCLLSAACGSPSSTATEAPAAQSGPPPIATAAASEGTRVVNLTMSPAIQDNGNRVLIEGFTNLPDGALIAYEVEHDQFGKGHVPLLGSRSNSGEERRAAQKTSLTWKHEGQLPVKAGHFIQALDVKDWPAGRIKVWVAFQTILGTSVEQPAEVIARYGEMGERIEGNQATTSGPMRRVAVERTVRKTGPADR